MEYAEVLVNPLKFRWASWATRFIRRYFVGADQHWVFARPAAAWRPAETRRSALYLHVPFCRHACPYCPYTKIEYDASLVEPYVKAAQEEIDWWADRIGNTAITSIYIGGGTPTLILPAIDRVLTHIRRRFNLPGEICIETNPADVNRVTVRQLHDSGVSLISVGVQSFRQQNLAILGRDYPPSVAERALSMLAAGGFASVNADIMFALPGQTVADIVSDLKHAARLGADQITTYPLFTFPYSSVGQYLRLQAVRMPGLKIRRAHYRAIHHWCTGNGFERVSVWGFKRGAVPRYSSVTRDGYIGIGPGAGSHLPDGFVLNTFDFARWVQPNRDGPSRIALRMPFTKTMTGWWWLYWRFYDTRIPLAQLDQMLGQSDRRVHRWLNVFIRIGLAVRRNGYLELTEQGAFWLHLAQNYFALNYVNTLWTQARRQTWPEAIAI